MEYAHVLIFSDKESNVIRDIRVFLERDDASLASSLSTLNTPRNVAAIYSLKVETAPPTRGQVAALAFEEAIAAAERSAGTREEVLSELFARAVAGDETAAAQFRAMATTAWSPPSIQPELDDEMMPPAWRPRVPWKLRAGLWALRVGLKMREHAADILYFVVFGVLLYLVGRFLPAPPLH